MPAVVWSKFDTTLVIKWTEVFFPMCFSYVYRYRKEAVWHENQSDLPVRMLKLEDATVVCAAL